MKNKKKAINKEKAIKKDWIYWTPRILSIVFLLFLAMFSLDVFDGHYGFWGTILGLFMHNIPVFFLLIVLLMSWRKEWIGGVMFILAGLLYIYSALIRTQFQWYALLWILQISGPAFFIGILFLVGWRRKKK